MPPFLSNSEVLPPSLKPIRCSPKSSHFIPVRHLLPVCLPGPQSLLRTGGINPKIVLPVTGLSTLVRNMFYLFNVMLSSLNGNLMATCSISVPVVILPHPSLLSPQHLHTSKGKTQLQYLMGSVCLRLIKSPSAPEMKEVLKSR